jgi:hypothetical protein
MMPELDVEDLKRIWRIMNDTVPNFHVFSRVLNFRRYWLEIIIRQSSGASPQSYIAQA